MALALLLLLPGTASAAVTDTPFGQTPEQRVAALAAGLPGFDDRVALSGFTQPVAVRFAADGTVFVAEKRGIVKRFSDLADVMPETVVDVRAPTHDYWDRGLIGLAIDPAYPARPYVYVSYAWDRNGEFDDGCADPTGNGCVVAGRIVRVNANTGAQTVLVEDYCQQFPSHSVGGLAFGADGALYASGGDGASFNYADERPMTGRTGNPCADPWREGGSIRSQDLRTSADPLGLDGTIVRLDPDTPLQPSQYAARIVAQGLRNPFRIAVRPGTSEVWSADVGWNQWEELNRLVQPGANYGWPCYEGAARMGTWDALDNPVCEGLYAQAGGHTAPYYAYDHNALVVPNETCPRGTSSISGLAFYNGGTFPAEYNGALFFADYARQCVWAMLAGTNGLPDKTKIRTFITSVPAVDVQVGPGGDLFYVDIRGDVRRVRATNGNKAPTARATATPDRGPLPLEVQLDGRASSDPDGTPLTYAWDFDGNGTWDSTDPAPVRTFTASGTHRPRLRVRDPSGLEDTTSVTVYAGIPPQATITAPADGTAWAVGDVLAFAGSGKSAGGAALPASALTWQLDLHHCPRDGCHVHPIQTWAGVAGGSVTAPDHEYPSHLELQLTATDGGLSTTVSRRLDPRTSRLRVDTDPQGLDAFLGSESGPAPLDAEVIVGSTTSLGVATPQQRAGRTWTFAGWPTGGLPARDVVAGQQDAAYTAAFSTPADLGAPPPVPTPDAGGVLPESIAKPRPSAWRLDPAKARLYGAARGGRGALVFDGAGDSALARAGGLDLRSGFTVSAWVRRARGSRGRGPVVVAPSFALGVRGGTTRWRRGLRVDAGVPVARWVRVALAWDGKVARVSVDGRVVARRRVAASVGLLSSVRVGGDPAHGAWLKGRVARVTVTAG
jgi:glucose/arabinose dehydrogenase